jgi:hypothetical protein
VAASAEAAAGDAAAAAPAALRVRIWGDVIQCQSHGWQQGNQVQEDGALAQAAACSGSKALCSHHVISMLIVADSNAPTAIPVPVCIQAWAGRACEVQVGPAWCWDLGTGFLNATTALGIAL